MPVFLEKRRRQFFKEKLWLFKSALEDTSLEFRIEGLERSMKLERFGNNSGVDLANTC